MKRLFAFACVIVLVVGMSVVAHAGDRTFAGDVQRSSNLRGDLDLPSRYRAHGPIAFARVRHGGSDIWSIRPDGSHGRQLTKSRLDDHSPAWNSGGTILSFVRERKGGRQDVFVMPFHGGAAPYVLIKNAADPAWSPDGTAIAFTRDVGGNRDIWIADAGGNGAMPITSDLAADIEPAWSPDAARIVFVSDRVGSRDIWSMARDGSDLRHEVDAAGRDRTPDYDATNSGIIYEHAATGIRSQCFQSLTPEFESSCGFEGTGDPSEAGFPTHGSGWASEQQQNDGGTAIVVVGGLLETAGPHDRDPAWRPVAEATQLDIHRAAERLRAAIAAAETWHDAYGSYAGADEGPSGLVTIDPELCYVDDTTPAVASGATCVSGAGEASVGVSDDGFRFEAATATQDGLCMWMFSSTFGAAYDHGYSWSYAPEPNRCNAGVSVYQSWPLPW